MSINGSSVMKMRLVSLCCVCCLATPLVAGAQTLMAPPASQLTAPAATDFWTPIKAVPQDLANLFSADNARILGIAAAGFMVAHRWDDDGIAMANRRFRPVSNFKPGNVGGGMTAQLGGAFAVYSIARATGHQRVAEVGSDLFRAQLLTQAMVQTMKVTFQRERPDGSNKLSLPSGHTASAIATATVLSRQFGWKVGIPAYAAGAYVAASRMSANKHHITDVMVGAAVGIVAGRTATIGTSSHRFAVGVAPTHGGAAITFTRK
jgi:membrane-associated phospholipid phosphatase